MFNKETYTKRRAELKKLVGNGVIILFGNNEAPANYPANGYAPFRQDDSMACNERTGCQKATFPWHPVFLT